MKKLKTKLSKQLLFLIGIIFAIVFISLGIVLPKILLSVAEESMYTYLREPLKFIETDVDNDLLNTEVAYIYLVDDKVVMYDNFKSLKGINDPSKILKKLNKSHGKFIYNHEIYYYYKIKNKNITKIAQKLAGVIPYEEKSESKFSFLLFKNIFNKGASKWY